MLLFTDGFEHFHPNDLWRKWGHTNFGRDVQVVFGDNESKNKPWARKGGRGLYFKGVRKYPFGNNSGTYLEGIGTTYCLGLGTPIKKSRTVHCGFALSSLSSGHFAFEVRFYSRNFEKKYPEHKISFGETYRSVGAPSNLVARCFAIVRGSVVDYFWVFPDGNIQTQFGQIESHTDLLSGDFYYFQTGMTIHGNNENGAAAWVESRIGQRNKECRIENIYTATPNSADSWFLDYVEFRFGDQPLVLDDFYICNEEGSANNDFLGNVIVRSTAITGEGSENNSESFGGSYIRSNNVVATELVNTTQNMPAEIPDPDADPLFLSWQDPRNSYVQLSSLEATQLFRMRHINFAGSEPSFFGAVGHGLFRAPYPNNGLTNLFPSMKAVGQTVEGVKILRPVEGFEDGRWELRSFIWENKEALAPGQKPTYWNSESLNNAEYGFSLGRQEDVGSDRYNPSVLRLKYIFEEAPSESLSLTDAPQRFWEERMEEYFVSTDTDLYQYVFPIYEEVFIGELSVANKACKKWLNSVVYCQDIIPWKYLYLSDKIALSMKNFLAFPQTNRETLALEAFSYGSWVEEFNSFMSFSDNLVWSKIFIAEDGFYIDTPEVFTNHFLVDENLKMDVSYLFSGHEMVEEFLYPSVVTPSWGWKMETEDGFFFDEDHFDGHWVEQKTLQFNTTDSVLTAQWRHEWFWGVCIASWQLEPVEMECPEGNRVGTISAQYYEMLGYEETPGGE